MRVDENHRFVELMPPGLPCSIALTTGYIDSQPGCLKGVQLNVENVDEVHAFLRDRDVEVSEIQDYPWGRFCFFSDPDGNGWSIHGRTPTPPGLIPKSGQLWEWSVLRGLGAKNPRQWGNFFDFRATYAEAPKLGGRISPVRITPRAAGLAWVVRTCPLCSGAGHRRFAPAALGTVCGQPGARAEGTK
jgi:hypothetical protein